MANGILDGFWEQHLNPWDYAAGVLLIQEAGGLVERIEGGPVGLIRGTVLAANSRQGLEALRRIALESGRELDYSAPDGASLDHHRKT